MVLRQLRKGKLGRSGQGMPLPAHADNGAAGQFMIGCLHRRDLPQGEQDLDVILLQKTVQRGEGDHAQNGNNLRQFLPKGL